MHKMLMLRSYGVHGVGWGGDVITFLWPRSLDVAQDADATLTWAGVVWGGVGWGEVGWVGIVTFLRLCSLDLSQDVDATLTWGGVGWDVNVPSTTFPRPFTRCWCYAHMGWGGVGWGCYNVPSATFPRPCTRCWCYTHIWVRWGGMGRW